MGLTPDGPVARALTAAVQGVVLLDEVPDPPGPLPVLHVWAGARPAIVGPLWEPGGVGCGECARRRMVAAGKVVFDAQPPAESSEGTLATLLIEQVRCILRDGLEASPLLGRVVALDPATATAELHRVIALARCPVCGGAATLPPPPERTAAIAVADPPEAILAALAGWLDPLTGVVPGLKVEETSPGLPVVVTVAPPRVVEDDGSTRLLPIGWGKGLTLPGALLSAVGEAIERYAPSLPDPARITWARQGDLEGDVLDPRTFGLYRDDQYTSPGFPYARYDEAAVHPWVAGSWLAGGAPVWVPAVATFLSLRLQPEQLICQGTSNGLAAGTGFEAAAARAILEVVERDALLTAWLTGACGRRVLLDEGLDPDLGAVLAGIQALGGAPEVYLLPTAACGTVAVCLALGDGERWPGVTLGLGADLDPATAIRQAILEQGQTGPHLRRMLRSGTLTAPAGPPDVVTMLDHAAYYFPPERSAAFEALRSGQGVIHFSDLAPAPAAWDPLVALRPELGAAGIDVALVDVTSADVATIGWHVVRAVAPALQPLTYGFGMDRRPVARALLMGLAADRPPIHPVW